MTSYFHTDSAQTVGWLANVFAQAAEQNRRVRIQTNEYNQLRLKVGEGVWTAPIASTPDEYRESVPDDAPLTSQVEIPESEDAPLTSYERELLNGREEWHCKECAQGEHGLVEKGRCVCCGDYLGRHRDWTVSGSQAEAVV
jgi:hypothetical protein